MYYEQCTLFLFTHEYLDFLPLFSHPLVLGHAGSDTVRGVSVSILIPVFLISDF